MRLSLQPKAGPSKYDHTNIMYYRLTQDEYGDYEKDGIRYALLECNAAYTPQGLNVGYTYFDGKDDAVQAWGLRYIGDVPEDQ